MLEASLLAIDERARCPRTVPVVELFLLLSPLSPRLHALGLRGPSPRPIYTRGQMGNCTESRREKSDLGEARLSGGQRRRRSHLQFLNHLRRSPSWVTWYAWDLLIATIATPYITGTLGKSRRVSVTMYIRNTFATRSSAYMGSRG